MAKTTNNKTPMVGMNVFGQWVYPTRFSSDVDRKDEGKYNKNESFSNSAIVNPTPDVKKTVDNNFIIKVENLNKMENTTFNNKIENTALNNYVGMEGANVPNLSNSELMGKAITHQSWQRTFADSYKANVGRIGNIYEFVFSHPKFRFTCDGDTDNLFFPKAMLMIGFYEASFDNEQSWVKSNPKSDIISSAGGIMGMIDASYKQGIAEGLKTLPAMIKEIPSSRRLVFENLFKKESDAWFGNTSLLTKRQNTMFISCVGFMLAQLRIIHKAYKKQIPFSESLRQAQFERLCKMNNNPTAVRGPLMTYIAWGDGPYVFNITDKSSATPGLAFFKRKYNPHPPISTYSYYSYYYDGKFLESLLKFSSW